MALIVYKKYFKPLILTVACCLLMACANSQKHLCRHRIEPNPFIKTMFFSENDTIVCDVSYKRVKDYYCFNILSTKDTVNLYINNKYIGSNLDTVDIKIVKSVDSSTIAVFPNASWGRLGYAKILFSDLKHTKGCFVKSTTPVSINVHLIVDFTIDNINPSYLEFEEFKEEEKSRVKEITDSLRMELFKKLNINY